MTDGTQSTRSPPYAREIKKHTYIKSSFWNIFFWTPALRRLLLCEENNLTDTVHGSPQECPSMHASSPTFHRLPLSKLRNKTTIKTPMASKKKGQNYKPQKSFEGHVEYSSTSNRTENGLIEIKGAE